MVTVTSAELGTQFDPLWESAMRESVSVLHEGEVRLVVLSATELERLRSLDSRRADYPWELPDEWVEASESAVPGPESLRYPGE